MESGSIPPFTMMILLASNTTWKMVLNFLGLQFPKTQMGQQKTLDLQFGNLQNLLSLIEIQIS